MASYLVTASYTPEGVKGVLKSGGTARAEAVKQGRRRASAARCRASTSRSASDDAYVTRRPARQRRGGRARSRGRRRTGLTTVQTVVLLTPGGDRRSRQAPGRLHPTRQVARRMGVTLCVLLWARAGRRRRARRVRGRGAPARRRARRRGTRARARTDGVDGAPLEIHLIEFPSEDAFDAYMTRPAPRGAGRRTRPRDRAHRGAPRRPRLSRARPPPRAHVSTPPPRGPLLRQTFRQWATVTASANCRAIPMFSSLSDDVLELLATKASDFDAPAGQVLVQANQPGSGLLILTSGQASVELGAQTLECGPGRVHRGALAADRRSRARRPGAAASDVRGFAISRKDFESLLDSDPRVALGLLHVLARRLVETDRLLTSSALIDRPGGGSTTPARGLSPWLRRSQAHTLPEVGGRAGRS